MLKIDFDELEFDPVCQVITVTATYQGKPFTGVAFVKDQKFHEYGEYIYVNGNAHGRWFNINTENDILILEEFYEHGIAIKEHRAWFNDGKISELIRYEDGQIVFSQYWNKDGILVAEMDMVKHTNKEWYDNGKLFRQIKGMSGGDLRNSEEVFHQNGELLMKIEQAENSQEIQYFFNTDFFYQYADLLDSHHYYVLTSFLRQTIAGKTLPEPFFHFLQGLTSHAEPFFRYEAARILGDLHSRESVKFLEKLLTDTQMPVLYDRNGLKKMGTIWSVGDMARKALEKIHSYGVDK